MRLAPSFFAVHRLNSHWDGVILSRVVGECATKWRRRDCETHLDLYSLPFQHTCENARILTMSVLAVKRGNPKLVIRIRTSNRVARLLFEAVRFYASFPDSS